MSSKKILNSVVALTEQRNSVSLAHSVLATLVEMLPVTSASMYHYLGSGAQLAAKIEVGADKQDIAWVNQKFSTPCPGIIIKRRV
ncbi:hypothetical protein [Vibrio sonorensis]|uniref:hypothetical protein n=1 Tax=Vibrio sonorensis TaxID=1004316 RepID=UPI001FE1D501|nr:hypothetical protein [Vibrio sonorensis]